MTHGIRTRMMAVVAALTMAMPSTAQATWSIVMADSDTKEVAVGTVTCLTTYDLLAIVPVVVVGKGAGAAQAAGDFAGIRRPVIFNGLIAGTSPADILLQLAGISGHPSRQYGIADTQGRTMTFTGTSTSQWAGGVEGVDGTLVYAIQGNILAGGCVVPAIEQAILNTPGDFAEKLMAGMEAAQALGGDGRCSCSPSNPMGCGCPPTTFTKSGHIGTMVVARLGDPDDFLCNASGCADGDYYMKFNVPFQTTGAPDPVFQLRSLFETWRATLPGRPDAIQSAVQLIPNPNPPPDTIETTLNVTLLDWQANPITGPIQSFTVTHASGSAGMSTIGPVTDLGGGSYSVLFSVCDGAWGVDLFTVRADDGIRPVVLMPLPAIDYQGDGAPPQPDPMTWETPPSPVSTTELTMTATEGIDPSLPVEYFIFWWGNGSGGNTSGWRLSRTYNDDGLTPNTAYTYQVRARDSACPRAHLGAYSQPPASGVTYIETPTGLSFGAVTDTTIEATADGVFTDLTLGQSGLFFEMTPPHGTGANAWVQTETVIVTGLTPGTLYTFRVKSRNAAGLEPPASWVGPFMQSTTGVAPCAVAGDLNGDGFVQGDDVAGYVRAKLGQAPAPGENSACADYGTGTLAGDTALFITDLLAP